MADTRPIMQGMGALFLALASLAEVALVYPTGAFSGAIAAQPPVLIHILAGGLAFAGILLFVFAPPSRKHERRVQLERPTVEDQTITPRRRSALPTTRGMEEKQQRDADRRKADAQRAKPEDPPAPEPRGRDPPTPEQPERDPPAPRKQEQTPDPHPRADSAPATPGSIRPPDDNSANGARRPDPRPSAPPPDTPAETPKRQPAPTPPSPSPPRHRGDLASGIGERRVSRVDTEPAPEAEAHDDPVALAERLEDLDRQANQLKVQFALGKLSPRGYRHMLDEVDTERSRIETVLVEHQRFD